MGNQCKGLRCVSPVLVQCVVKKLWCEIVLLQEKNTVDFSFCDLTLTFVSTGR